jgi:hypothetical protein
MTGGVPLPAELDPGGAGAATAAALDACDRLLGEIGRRQHRFAWLRGPGDDVDYLEVDGYYPGNRVVVCCQSDPFVRARFAELVPAHGLYLVSLDRNSLRAGVPDVTEAVGGQLRDAGWTPRPKPRPTPTPRPEAAPAPAPPARAAYAIAAVPARRTSHAQRFGIEVGIALCLVVLLEAYLAVVVLAVNGGRLVLGFGLLLDACTRAVSTIAAAQEGDDEAMWTCLVIGSPAVLAAPRPRGPNISDGARLAATLATLAAAITAFGVLLALLGD